MRTTYNVTWLEQPEEITFKELELGMLVRSKLFVTGTRMHRNFTNLGIDVMINTADVSSTGFDNNRYSLDTLYIIEHISREGFVVARKLDKSENNFNYHLILQRDEYIGFYMNHKTFYNVPTLENYGYVTNTISYESENYKPYESHSTAR